MLMEMNLRAKPTTAFPDKSRHDTFLAIVLFGSYFILSQFVYKKAGAPCDMYNKWGENGLGNNA